MTRPEKVPDRSGMRDTRLCAASDHLHSRKTAPDRTDR